MPETGLSQKKNAATVTSVTDAASNPGDAAGESGSPAKLRDPAKLREFGGPAGLEPTRYGDWERKGRCIDF